MFGLEVYELLKYIDDGNEPTEQKEEQLSRIETIYWDDSINVIPNSIGLLKKLRILDISWSSFHRHSLKIPNSIGELTNLQSLKISGTGIGAALLPSTIGNLKQLESLFLKDTRISKLPLTIGSCKNLKSLNLNSTNINRLPNSIENLNNLQGLDISKTKITELTKPIGGLINLQTFYMNYTLIEELPDEIGKLSRLRSIYMHRSNITKLPKSIGNLKNLQILDLSYSKIQELPNTISNLNNLQSLDLSHTKINELPDDIWNMEHLQVLDLSYTEISSLPESLEHMKSLQTLILSNTNIRQLPVTIGELPQLKTIVLEDLILYRLPESLLKLELDYKDTYYSKAMPYGIYIKNLKLTQQPIETFSQSRELIIEYYKYLKDSVYPINECKIVFLGDGGVGKSLIIDRLTNNGNISPDFDGDATPGINISTIKCQIGTDEIVLHLWDFGGQAIMHSMHRLFLTNRTLYIVVVNARDNKANDQAWYWLRNINSFAKGVPIFLLVNQKDQNPSININETGLRKEFPEIRVIKTVSALKDSQNEFNTDIRDNIYQIVLNMETVHTPFSSSWLSLMKDLQDMPVDYITSVDFYKKCRLNGIDTKEELLDEIISWYQDLGVCFYSKKHPSSRQYMVLKPRWLLNALYILIFNGRKYSINGIIKEDDIYRLICEKVPDAIVRKVWSEIQYKENEIQYIINVLLNFELVFRLDNKQFFIPMLCDENEPEIIESFKSENALHLSFRYTYLPENVLHRLMVRHGYELNTNAVWRTGATFERESMGWSALVRIKDNCLDVFTQSLHQDIHPVNSYLDMLRDSIYRINDEFGLSVNEYIAYSKKDKEDFFEYKALIGSKESGITKIYSPIFQCAISVDEILGIIKDSDVKLTEDIIEQLFSVLVEMSERSADLKNRGETELTADFQSSIAPVLNAKYDLHVSREYTMGNSIKKMGETDLYFFRDKDGVKRGLYIVENKVITSFLKQYRQLLGYLNPNLYAGITLSINKNKGWEESFDYICDKLQELKESREEFFPIYIERMTTPNGTTKYVKSEHVVPETGLTMPVYHLVLQLSNDARQRIAKKARKSEE